MNFLKLYFVVQEVLGNGGASAGKKDKNGEVWWHLLVI
jgi:hypothetical protein